MFSTLEVTGSHLHLLVFLKIIYCTDKLPAQRDVKRERTVRRYQNLQWFVMSIVVEK